MQEAGDGQEDEGDRRDGTCELLDGTADAEAVPLKGAEDEQDGERDRRLYVEESGEEGGEVFCCSDRPEGDYGAVVKPVGPAHREGGCGAEGAPGVDVEAAGLRHRGA